MKISRALLFQTLDLAAWARRDKMRATHLALIEAAQEIRRRLCLYGDVLP